MEPNAFIAEVYTRMNARYGSEWSSPKWEEFENNPVVTQAAYQYKTVLPERKDAAILDIGLGRGWFIAACIKLGYSNVYGADFGAENRCYIKKWSASIKEIYNIEKNIGDFLAEYPGTFDFIHLSHVLEHIPKHSLFYMVDALYFGMKKGGKLLIRTPNMEGPCSSSSMYVSLGHEYGFSGSNLVGLLDLCNFEDITLHKFGIHNPTLKRRIGLLLRWPFVRWNAVRHRLFGVNSGGVFGQELIVSAVRGDRPPLFNEKYK